MINDIVQEVSNRLKELYPNHYVYFDDILQKFTTPSFLIKLILQDYDKRINTKYKSRISFDVAYFSDKDDIDIKSDCLIMQESLFRNFDFLETVRVLNKQAEITDNVLHFSFDIHYAEMKAELGTKMQTQQTNTTI